MRQKIRLAFAGLILASAAVASVASAQAVERGLSAALEAVPEQLLDTSGAAIAAGAHVGTWTDGTATFTLANNPNPGAGPVYRAAGDDGFDSALFNGHAYLWFDAPESLSAADPGDALYSEHKYLTPTRFAPVRGSVFFVFAPQITIDRGDIFGTRSNHPELGTSNGFFVEPRLSGADVASFWNGNPGGAGGYSGDLAAFSGDMLNDGTTAYIIEWRSMTSNDGDGHRAFYVNGELVGSDTESTINPAGVGGFGIGGTLDNPNALNGAVAGVYIYEQELTEAERNTVGAALQDKFGITGSYSAPGQVSAEPILIDFGKAALTSGGAIPAWNDVVPPVSGSSSITGANMVDTIFPYTLVENLVDAAGNETGVRLVFSEWIPQPDATGNGNGIAGLEVPGVVPTTGYPESATMDSLFVNAGVTIVIALEGLDPSLAYDLTMFGLNSANDTRISQWTVNGIEQQQLTDSNSGLKTVFAAVVPDATGRIEIRYTHPPLGRPQGHWSTLEIRETEQPVFDVLDGRAVAGERLSPWMGQYYSLDGTHLATVDGMRLSLATADENNLWMRSHESASWWWTARADWPHVFDANSSEWYYVVRAGGYVYLYRFSDGQWLELIGE